MRKIIFTIVFAIFTLVLKALPVQDYRVVIHGRVTDREGKGLTGATVSIENKLSGVLTDSEGNYSFSGLKEGLYKLRFSFVGYETAVKEVNLTGVQILNIILEPLAVLTEDVLVTATRAGEHAPLAYSEIGRDLLKKQNTGYDLPYIIGLTPSLTETSEAGNGIGYTGLRIRGTDGNRINVTIDGIPLNDPESQQVFWVDLPDITSSVESIQVQRGAGTSSNGSGAFGATISLQTANPENEPFAEVSASGGSFGTMKEMVSAGTGLLGGKFAMQMRYSGLKSDGYIYRTGSTHKSGFLSATYRTGRSRLKFNVILGQEHTGIGWWGVPAEMLKVDRRYNPAGEYTDGEGNKQYYDNESDNYIQNHYQLMYSLKINGLLSFNASFHYTKGKGYYEEFREDQTLTDYGLKPFSIGDSLISQTSLIRRKWMSNDFYGAVYSLKYKKERIEAIVGGGSNIYYGDHYGSIIWMKYPGNTPRDYRWYFNNSTKGEVSIYGKLNYSLSDKTAIYGDVQYRFVQHKMEGPDDDLKDITQVHSYNFLNPKAGVFYSISSLQDAYLSFSVANREPTRSDFTEASGDGEATPKPETLYDLEAGYKIHTGIGNFGANLYGMFYHDQLVPTGELSNVGYSIMTNVEKSHRLGLELTTEIKPASFISLDASLTLSSNKIIGFVEYFTNYNTDDWSSQYLSRNLGNTDIAYSPSLICSGDLGFRIGKGINFHLISKYVGKQYFDNTMNHGRVIDPYFVNNVRLDLEPALKNIGGVEFQLLINNILNEVYENNAYGGNWFENGEEKSWAYYFPQAGRNFMARLSLKF
jgi:iron complex outermembrane recepter protein